MRRRIQKIRQKTAAVCASVAFMLAAVFYPATTVCAAGQDGSSGSDSSVTIAVMAVLTGTAVYAVLRSRGGRK